MPNKSFLFVPVVLSFVTACGGRQPPYSAAEALSTFRLPEGLRIELAAAEPEIADPVAMAFDASGRMFVVEMPDYPMGKYRGRIKLLEDRNQDGRFESSVVFATDLAFPNGVLPWRKGVLVTAAPDILYLGDNNGDGKADERRVLLTGFAALNPQLRVNGLVYGYDNWIYGAYPKFGPPSRYVREFGDMGSPLRFPEHPEVQPVDVFGRGMDFRFRIDKLKLEPIAGNSQYGNTFDSRGNRFTVWNNNHIRHVVVENRYLERNPYLAVESAMESISDHGNAATVYPITREPLHMHESEIGHFTSACGLHIYLGGLLPAPYDGAAFVAEPVHNLVHCDNLLPSGPTFKAERLPKAGEFLSSTDSWFRPVHITTGPDGALYVVDFYRKIVEHPEWIPPEMMNEADLLAGHGRGRVYRITSAAKNRTPAPDLERLNAHELAGQLEHPNSWRRITAQRLLVERQDRTVAPHLKNLLRKGSRAEARVHALWTLDGLASLETLDLIHALFDRDGLVRLHGIRAAEQRIAEPAVAKKLLSMADDPSPGVRFQLACALGSIPGGEAFEALRQIAWSQIEDQWFQIAALSGAQHGVLQWFRALAHEPSFWNLSGASNFMRRVTSLAAATGIEVEVTEILSAVAAAGNGETVGPTTWWRAPAVEGLAAGSTRAAGGRLRLGALGQKLVLEMLVGSRELRRPALDLARHIDFVESRALRRVLGEAAGIASEPKAPVDERAHAAGILSLGPGDSFQELLLKLILPREPAEVQTAAAKSLLAMKQPPLAVLLERWKTCTAPVRDAVLAGIFKRREHLSLLLDALESGKVEPWSLTPARKSQLLRHAKQEKGSRSAGLMAELAGGGRRAVIERFRPALRLGGDRSRGQDIFARNCGKCHRAGDSGFEVGPDIVSLSNRTREDLLLQILDPNAYVAPGFEEYAVETVDGRMLHGVVAGESATTLTLRRAGGEKDTVLRHQIARLRVSNVSQMPEDLEQGMSVQDMADLLEYLKTRK